MKIPRAVFRYVEYELYNYEVSRRQLEEALEDGSFSIVEDDEDLPF